MPQRTITRIAACLPPKQECLDEEALEQEEVEASEEEMVVLDDEMEEGEQEEEEEPPSDEEEEASTPEQDGFEMEDAVTEFEVAQVEEAVEQQTILESIQFETEVAANRRVLHEMDMVLQ